MVSLVEELIQPAEAGVGREFEVPDSERGSAPHRATRAIARAVSQAIPEGITWSTTR
jgi:hypothetical protein